MESLNFEKKPTIEVENLANPETTSKEKIAMAEKVIADRFEKVQKLAIAKITQNPYFRDPRYLEHL
ncbi:MAG: hypothetical protein GX627_02565 [Parcubacteria group bacterium]|jgi:hypothetical protein|nr:hypothetical protein [Parcubacteria group bacterium]